LLSAPLTNEIATLTFSGELNDAAQSDRKRIVAQLVWTLTSLTQAQIDAVDVKVEGGDFVIGPEPDTAAHTRARWSAYNPDGEDSRRPSYFNLGGYLTRYRPSAPLRIGRAIGPATAAPAVDYAEAQVAITAPATGGRRGLSVAPLTSGKVPPPIIQAAHMTKPSWGPTGDGVWIVKQDEKVGPEVFLVPFPQDARRIPTRDARDLTTRVHAFEVAPDGIRVAVIYEIGGAPRVFIGLIERDPVGRAQSVGSLTDRPIAPDINAAAVAWVDSGRLAVVGGRGAEELAVFTVAVDGSNLRESLGSRDKLRNAKSTQLLARGGETSGAELLLVIDGRIAFRDDNTGWKELTIREDGA
jgi:hypothetical protein